MLTLDQELRVTSDLKAYSQFTFYLVNTALIQASMAEKEEMLSMKTSNRHLCQPSWQLDVVL